MFFKPKHFIFECRPNFESFCPLPGLLRAIVFSATKLPLHKFLRTPLLVIVYKPLKENLRSGKDNWIINTTHHISKTISHQMYLIWNSLPKSLRSCNQTNVFKKELKTYFFNEAFRDLK